MNLNLTYLTLEVTRRCNMGCAHCLRGEAENLDMTKEIVDKALEDVEFISSLTLSGGEPTLNTELIRYILDVCIEKEIVIEELFVATNGKEVPLDFLHAMIDWDAYDGLKIGGNEIDVMLMDDSLPVFISCKLRDADTAALNELLVAKKRLGGWFSKGVIVTYSKEKQEKTGTYERCKELGLEMLDERDILAADFRERLVRTIREHDLVNLKWKKV